MEHTSFHNYIKNISINETFHTEHILKTGRRAQISERARKPPCNGWEKREKEGKKSGLDLCPQEESCEGRKGSTPRKSPHGQRYQPGEGELWSLGGEHSNWFVVGKVENDLYRWSGPPP